MCQVSQWPGQKRAEDMEFSDFKLIIDSCPSVFEVKIQGFGEPLLGADFFEMADYADSLGIWTRTTINGTLL